MASPTRGLGVDKRTSCIVKARSGLTIPMRDIVPVPGLKMVGAVDVVAGAVDVVGVLDAVLEPVMGAMVPVGRSTGVVIIVGVVGVVVVVAVGRVMVVPVFISGIVVVVPVDVAVVPVGRVMVVPVFISGIVVVVPTDVAVVPVGRVMVVPVFISGIVVVVPIDVAVVPVGRVMVVPVLIPGIVVGVEVLGVTPVTLGITGTGLLVVALVPEAPTGLIAVPIGRMTVDEVAVTPVGRVTTGNVPVTFPVLVLVAVPTVEPAVGLVMPGIVVVAVVTGRTPPIVGRTVVDVPIVVGEAVVTGLVAEMIPLDVGRVVVTSPGTVAPMGLLNVPFGRRTSVVAPGMPPTLEATGRTPTVLPARLKLDGRTDLIGALVTGLVRPAEAVSVDNATGRDITGDLADKPGATDTLAEAVPFNAPFAPPVNSISTPCSPALSRVISVNMTERVCFGSTVPSDFVCTCFPSTLNATPTPAMLAEYGLATENVSEEAWPAIGTAPFRANTMSVTWGRPTGILELTSAGVAGMPPGPLLPAPEPPTTLIPPSASLPEPDVLLVSPDALDPLAVEESPDPLDAVEPLPVSLPEVVSVDDVPEDAVPVEPESVVVDDVPESVVPLVPPASATVTFTDF